MPAAEEALDVKFAGDPSQCIPTAGAIVMSGDANARP
jgi:hypothetical protein